MLTRARCCCCPVTVHVTCFGSAVSGASVMVTKGGVTVATGTTDGSGNFVFAIPTLNDGQTYHIVASKTGVGSNAQDSVVHCKGTINIEICSAALNCGPCNIPESTLHTSWNGPAIGSGSGNLTWDGASQWNMGCQSATPGTSGYNSVKATVKCFMGIIQLQFSFFTDGACTQNLVIITRTGTDSGLSYTCSPFSFTWTTAGPTTITLTA